jgi:two-component system phosphate regulon sensor histidine kinase PhoR
LEFKLQLMNSDNTQQLAAELAELKFQLEEANDTIEAIRTGMVDAFVVYGDQGHQLYTLKTADQTYRVLVEKMGEGAITLNKHGMILYSNSRFAEMLDIGLDAVVGKHVTEFISEKDSKGLLEKIETPVGRDYKTEVTLRCANRAMLPVLLALTNLNLEDGTAWSLLFTDLSRQKVTERLLKQNNDALEAARNEALILNDELENTVTERTRDLSVSREHFILLANNIPQITWTNSSTGQFSFFNQRWYDYTGLSNEESFEQAWENVIHPEDLLLTTQRFRQSMATGEVFEVENRFKRQDGVYRWHLNRCVPLRNAKGELLFWVGTATDIDDQRKAIEKKDEFIGIASHELKTPLTTLKGYLQLIAGFKKQPVPDQVKSFIIRAESSISKLQTLVNDLLDVSKIQAGKLHFSMQPMNVNELVDTCVENSRLIFPDYHIIWTPGIEYWTMGNFERLEQVLMNLINNAVKYSPLNKDIILNVDKQDDYVRMTVRDFGIGLSIEQQEKIFERFYRVDEKNYMASGLGMGLFICMDLVKSHGGKMGVSSQINEGSSFYVLLPLLPGLTTP